MNTYITEKRHHINHFNKRDQPSFDPSECVRYSFPKYKVYFKKKTTSEFIKCSLKQI